MAWSVTRSSSIPATRTAASRAGSNLNRARCRLRTTPSVPTWPIDHTKIRVLYLEGANEQYAVQRVISGIFGNNEPRGAYSPLQQALMEDPDVECTAVMPGGAGRDFSTMVRTNEQWRGFPETASELFAFDAIILSNVPRDSLSDQHLAWIEEWIGRRGGGLCMAGGPYSFATGRWNETSVGKMLPVELLPGARDWDEVADHGPAGHRGRHPPDLASFVRRGSEPFGAQDPAQFPGKQSLRPGEGRGRGAGPHHNAGTRRCHDARHRRSDLRPRAARWP